MEIIRNVVTNIEPEYWVAVADGGRLLVDLRGTIR
jgi:hypothetical protein